MARIKLVEQEAYEFHYTVSVEPRDINAGGHLSNDALVSLLGTAKARMFQSLDLKPFNLDDGETGIIMSDLAVNYKAQAYLFDKITIETHIGEFFRTGFRMFHRLKRDDVLVALAESGMITYNYNMEKIVAVPETFLKLIKRLTEASDSKS
ncbi:MAG: acyl-CoA thioesterase [Smithellaceae bacterium]